VALFDSEARGEIVLDGIPEDIARRLEHRVDEQRWVEADFETRYRVFDRAERPQGYRDGPSRASSIRVQIVQPARFSALLEDVELDFTDPRRVVYCVRFPRAQKGAMVMGGAVGGIFGLLALFMVAMAPDPRIASFVAILVPVLVVFLTASGISDTKRRAVRTIERILRSEISASRNEAEILAAGRNTSATAQAVLSVLGARGIELTDAERALVLGTTDDGVLDELLKRAATATRMSDVLERRGSEVRVASDEEGAAPVSARARRGLG
jgi:hypothetical protein